MLFRRKYEFKPDKTESSAIKKLYLTPTQRKRILKWVLVGTVLLVLSLLQDAVLSRISIYGATFDLVACGILLAGMLFDPDVTAVFALTSSTIYYFSGTAPGVYAIALLTALSVFLCMFRCSYLQRCFGANFMCAAVGMMVYELLVFAICLFLGSTTGDRLVVFALRGGLSVAVMPALYPIFTSISNIGGQTWNE